jgi:Aspartyl/Asparaginyl beta-hydroxylase
MDRFLLLPVLFDVPALLRDLAICETHHWASHYNKADYAGDWKGISLRSANGLAENILATESSVYKDTPLMDACHYFREITAGLGCVLETVRLLALAPGSKVKTHRDPGLAYSQGCFRLHIPILTDHAVSFIVDGEKIPMEAGQCWYANFDLPHSVANEGIARRVHLVIDGKRNEQSDALFAEAGYNFSAENKPLQYDEKTKAMMIERLKEMGTETALRLIAELEQTNSG